MLLTKKGFPEEDELVLCTVTAIHFHSVFVTLDEYGSRTGMIHISEVAPGRIRNIREFVKEGKKIVCKVLRINKEKGHIDLSLRRVNEAQKRLKLNQIKQEQLAEKIVELIARQNKVDPKKFYSDLYEKLSKKHAYLFDVFEEATKDKTLLEKLGVDKKTSDQLLEAITQRIKPPEVTLRGDFKVICYEGDGVERIKSLFTEITEKNMSIMYIGAGQYRLSLTSHDVKEAEKAVQKKAEEIIGKAKRLNVEAEFQKVEA